MGLGSLSDVADEPDGWGKPDRGRSRAEHEALLAAKLTPSALKFTLAFAGLFQLTHELLKSAILNQVRQYYWRGFNASGDLYDVACQRDGTTVLPRGWDHLEVLSSMADLVSGVNGDAPALPVGGAFDDEGVRA